MNLASESIYPDLVTAMLTVNGWNLDKVAAIASGLKDSGLFDATLSASLDFPEFCTRLEKAGYKRGNFMVALLAERIMAAAKQASDEKLISALKEAEERHDRKSIASLLEPIKGIGPSVIETYLALRGV